MQNFIDSTYLKYGNHKQKLAYKELVDLALFEKLADYQPVLCGTIPIEIDTDESDWILSVNAMILDVFTDEN
ncbi:MAG: DUF4269 domain-containing protein [Chloroflexia bacterium]|nr:DUF4269 domain-containing protein [Chloroflexia bacterium]